MIAHLLLAALLTSPSLPVVSLQGPGHAPHVRRVTPSQVNSVVVDGAAIVALDGMNFTGTTTIIIDGTPLPAFPPMFSIVSDYRLLFSLPPQSKLGPVDVVLKNAFGQTRCEVNIVPNAVPALELASSEPNFLIKALGMNVSISGNPDDITYVMMSTSLGSTTRAGLFDIPLAIGNSGTNLVMRGPFRIGDSGHLDMTIAIDQIPPGTTLHVQAANALLSNNYALPLSVSNHQTGTILF